MTTTPSQQPTLKLGIAFAGTSVLFLQNALRELQEHDFAWSGWLMTILICGSGIWISWTGIFRTAGLQLIWGWACLILGLLVVVMIATHWREPAWAFLPEALALPVTGWLLVVDRDVARYRTHLRNLEDKRSKLRLED